MIEISILCPTRKRPNNIKRFIDSIEHTCKDISQVEVIFYIDKDDSISTPVILEYPPPLTKVYIGSRIFQSDMYNYIGPIALGNILMFTGDDVVFRTKGWDQIVIDTFEHGPKDKILLVYGSDVKPVNHIVGLPEDFGTQFFIHRNWAEAVGYISPKFFCTDFTDCWFNEIAQKLDRRKQIPIIVEHMHYLFGKAEKDQTYIDRLELKARYKPDNSFLATKGIRNKSIQDLQRFIDEQTRTH